MTTSLLHTELTILFVNKNAFTHFTNEGLEISIYYEGINNMELAKEIQEYLKSRGFESKITGRKYKKIQVIC